MTMGVDHAEQVNRNTARDLDLSLRCRFVQRRCGLVQEQPHDADPLWLASGVSRASLSAAG